MAAHENAVRFELASTFDAPVDALWDFHMRSDALERLSPSLLGFEVVNRGRGVSDGSVVDMRVGRWPMKQRWSALHVAVDEGRAFTDVALEAPFPYWVHNHSFEAAGDTGSRLTDTVWFVPPAWMPRAIAASFCRAGLKLLFAWRHAVTRRHLSSRNGSGERSWCLLGRAAFGGSS